MNTLNVRSLAAIPLLIGVAISAGCSHSNASPSATAPPPPTVSVAEVVSKPIRDFEEFSGRLEPVTTVSVQPRVAGFIESAQFTEGSRVKKGQILFRIDPRPFQAEVDRLAAQLKHAHTQSNLAATNDQRGEQPSQKRPGYEDGAWHLPSGHLEAGESVVTALIREAQEEIGVIIDAHEVEFCHVMHNSSSGGRVAFFFTVRRWVGDPENREPDKCSGLRWFPLAALPDQLIPYCRTALECITADHCSRPSSFPNSRHIRY